MIKKINNKSSNVLNALFFVFTFIVNALTFVYSATLFILTTLFSIASGALYLFLMLIIATSACMLMLISLVAVVSILLTITKMFLYLLPFVLAFFFLKVYVKKENLKKETINTIKKTYSFLKSTLKEWLGNIYYTIFMLFKNYMSFTYGFVGFMLSLILIIFIAVKLGLNVDLDLFTLSILNAKVNVEVYLVPFIIFGVISGKQIYKTMEDDEEDIVKFYNCFIINGFKIFSIITLGLILQDNFVSNKTLPTVINFVGEDFSLNEIAKKLSLFVKTGDVYEISPIFTIWLSSSITYIISAFGLNFFVDFVLNFIKGIIKLFKFESNGETIEEIKQNVSKN